jgi:hypothetical protein
MYKMKAVLADTIQYHLRVEDKYLTMNEAIGKKVVLHFQHEIYCVACGRLIKKSFSNGFCYNCFIAAPENAECILRPELCLAHEGKGRDVEWEREHHLKEHVVYLALSSEVKVGVTRSTQIPTRWIDQGASSAIKLAVVPYRQLAGMIEVEMKKFFTDKTSWQQMLKGTLSEKKLLNEKYRAKDVLPAHLNHYFCEDDTMTTLCYPVLKYPIKIKSIDFEKQPFVESVLVGIKGQYLIFEDDSVLNIRKHTGYVVSVNW